MSYSCRACGHIEELPPPEECPNCGGLYRYKNNSQVFGSKRSTFAKAADVELVYHPTGFVGFDLSIGGGLVEECTILLGGQYGSGKSQLGILVADAVATKYERGALFASSEQSVEGVHVIVKRLGCGSDRVTLLGNQSDLERVLKEARVLKPALLVIDSMNKLVGASLKEQEAAVKAIVKFSRETKVPAVVINQLNKSGDFKGSTEGVHGFDVILMLGFARPDDLSAPFPTKSDKPEALLLANLKSRQGGADTYWLMSKAGVIRHAQPRSRKLRRTYPD